MAQRMVVEPPPPRLGRRPIVGLREVGDVATRAERRVRFEQPKHSDVDAVSLPRALDDGLGLRPPVRGDGERRKRPEQLAGSCHEDQPNDSWRGALQFVACRHRGMLLRRLGGLAALSAGV